eukprot:jgi/Chrzof1/14390/Cz09g00300.t1
MWAHVGVVIAMQFGGAFLQMLILSKETPFLGYMAILLHTGGLTTAIAGTLGLLIWLGVFTCVYVLMGITPSAVSAAAQPIHPPLPPPNTLAVELPPITDSSRGSSNTNGIQPSGLRSRASRHDPWVVVSSDAVH